MTHFSLTIRLYGLLKKHNLNILSEPVCWYLEIDLKMTVMSMLCVVYLVVQQCFGVVYHELTMLRQVYFAYKPVLALLIHDNPRRILCLILFNTDKTKFLHVIKWFPNKAKWSVGYHELTTLCACTYGIRELLKRTLTMVIIIIIVSDTYSSWYVILKNVKYV